MLSSSATQYELTLDRVSHPRLSCIINPNLYLLLYTKYPNFPAVFYSEKMLMNWKDELDMKYFRGVGFFPLSRV
jgi:hypothetical protein